MASSRLAARGCWMLIGAPHDTQFPHRVFNTTTTTFQMLARLKWDKDQRGVGRWMRETFEAMGPLFVKVMQFVSVRGEGLDPEILEELVNLRDSVNPFDCSEYRGLLATFGILPDEPPIACGSVAAVFRGRTQEGQDVAVKVVRPNLKELFSQGLDDMQSTCRMLRGLRVQQSENISEMLMEMRPVILGETDLNKEAENARAFYRWVEHLPWVRVPEIIASGESWLAMEYIPSVKIDDVLGIGRILPARVVSLRLAACFALQIIQNGLFHADLHSGNAGVTEEGHLVFYDMGAVVSLDVSPRNCIKKLFRPFITGDAQSVVDALAGMGVLDLSECRSPKDAQSLTDATCAIIGQLLSQAGNPEDVHTIISEQKILGRNEARVFRPKLEFLYLLRNGGLHKKNALESRGGFSLYTCQKDQHPHPPPRVRLHRRHNQAPGSLGCVLWTNKYYQTSRFDILSSNSYQQTCPTACKCTGVGSTTGNFKRTLKTSGMRTVDKQVLPDIQV